jgi:hypothetical protein
MARRSQQERNTTRHAAEMATALRFKAAGGPQGYPVRFRADPDGAYGPQWYVAVPSKHPLRSIHMKRKRGRENASAHQHPRVSYSDLVTAALEVKMAQ